jgi:RHS repeat-associated protein
VVLTATPNQDITKSGYRLSIVDETTQSVLRQCYTGHTTWWSDGSCSTSTSFTTGPSHTYRAYVSYGSSYYTLGSGLQATSGDVTAERASWGVELVIDKGSFAAGEQVVLTATPNQNITLSGYRLSIVDETTQSILRQCYAGQTTWWTGGSCSTSTSFTTGPAHTYRAYVFYGSSYYTLGSGLQATSGEVTAERAPWGVELAIDQGSFAAGERVVLTATPNQDITLSAYRVYIADVTSDRTLAVCAVGAVARWADGACSVEASFATGDAHTYRAYVSRGANHLNGSPVVDQSISQLTDVQALSGDVTAEREPWVAGLAAVREAGSDEVTLTAVANQDVTQAWPYWLFIMDTTTGRGLRVCAGALEPPATECSVTVTVNPQSPHVYRSYVARGVFSTTGAPLPAMIDNMYDVQAMSPARTLSSRGPTLDGEVAGGSNPSEPCSQPCHADPVNSATGEFWESTVDLGVAGVGPALVWSRTYSASRAQGDGALGHGWSHTFGLTLLPVGASTITDAQWVDVLQENGSVVRFAADADGEFAAPDRVLATLERASDGGFVFTRRAQQVFEFDADGVLTRMLDRNGNALTLTYDEGRLVQVADTSGRSIDLDWSGERIAAITDHTGRAVSYTYDGAGDLVSAVAVDGTVTSYTYDDDHRVTTITHSDGGVTTNTYDDAGRVVSQADPLGRLTTFSYGDGQTTVTDPTGMVTIETYDEGQLVALTKAAGTAVEATTSFTYGPTNQVLSTTDPLGRTTTFAYDDRGNRTEVTDALGRTVTAVFDQWNNPLTTTNAAGETTSFSYDDHGNLASSTNPAGETTTFTVNLDGTVATSTDPTGRTTAYTYDARGFLATATGPDGATGVTSYDSLGNLVATTDPRGTVPGASALDYTTTLSYDAMGRLLRTTDPLAAVVTQAYDAAGRPTTTTTALGATTTVEYDLAGQLVSVTDALGNEATFTYDGAGRVLTVTDAAGATSANEYDALGRLIAVTDALGRVSRTEYDAGNRVVASVAPSGARTTYAYDAADQLVAVTDPLGKVMSTTYDDAGRPVTSTDADGRAVTTEYDAASRPVEVTRADGSALSWTYDAAGRVLTSTDAAGAAATYTYDAAGRLATSTDTAGRATSYTYGPSGHLQSVALPGGGTVAYSYDAVGRRTGIDYSDATPDATFVYDDAGRTVEMTDGTGTTTYTYDQMDQLTGTNHAGAAVGYEWDTVGRLTQLTYPNGQAVGRSYDDAGQLTSVTDWTDREFTFDWTDDGQLEDVSYPNGVVTSYARDVAGRVTGMTAASQAGQDLLELAYGYSEAGLMTERALTRGTNTEQAGFAWDALARVDAVTGVGAGEVSFDAAGSLTVLPDGRALAYDAARQVTSITAPAAAGLPAVTTSFTYDARGNRVAATADAGPDAGAVTHTFDLANRLTSVTGVDGVATSYTYDGAGLRASATTGGATETYVWDFAAAFPLLLTDADHAYVYGTGGVPLAQVALDDGAVDYLHTDAIGSVVSTTDGTGTVTTEVDYDLYGVPRTVQGSDAVAAVCRFGYAGEYTDPTGYLYLRARYYDPTTAQFLTVDPLVDSTGNPYGYTTGNPLQYVDPLGLRDGWYDAGDWTAAFADALTLGGTRWIRERMGTNDVVDTCSDFYEFGGYAGNLASLVPIGGGGVKATAWLADHAPSAAALVNGARTSVSGWADNAAAAISSRLPSASHALSAACSFEGSVLVLMADGTRKQIDEVVPGDEVIATDPETGESSARSVTHVFVHNDTVVDLALDGETITTTEDHPFWNATDGEYERADELDTGDHVLTADGTQVTVAGLDLASARTDLAYNLTVEGAHTYHVGLDEVLVHNTCPVGGAGPVRTGQAGETAVGLPHNTQSVVAPSGATRIPDILEDLVVDVGEIKNVDYQWLSTQLRDSMDIATARGSTLDLFVRENTRLSGPLLRAADQGLVNIFNVLP